MAKRRRVAFLSTVAVTAACHHAPPSTGPRNVRSAAECAPIIAQVRADSALRATLHASTVTIGLPHLPPPPGARGHKAELWVPVDERGRTRASDVRISGMPDGDYALELRRTAAKAKWQPAVRDGCWVPGWAYVTFSFSG